MIYNYCVVRRVSLFILASFGREALLALIQMQEYKILAQATLAAKKKKKKIWDSRDKNIQTIVQILSTLLAHRVGKCNFTKTNNKMLQLTFKQTSTNSSIVTTPSLLRSNLLNMLSWCWCSFMVYSSPSLLPTSSCIACSTSHSSFFVMLPSPFTS